MEFLRKNKLCFRCLDQEHMLNQCESKEECKVSECSDKRHDTLLHKHTSTSTSEVSDPVDPESVKCAATAGTRKCKQTPYFMRAPVKVCYQNNTTVTFAFLDTGSQQTFCGQSLVSKLGAEGTETLLPIQTLSSGINSKMVSSSLISLSIQSLDGNNKLNLKDVFTVDKISMRASTIPCQSQLDSMDHLQGVEPSE